MMEIDRLQMSPEEWIALAVRWPRLPQDEQQRWLNQMTRAQRRRHERQVLVEAENQRLGGHKNATLNDVVRIQQLFWDRKIVPLGARLDALETVVAFMNLPFYVRWRIRLKQAWVAIVNWLGSHRSHAEPDFEEADDGEGQVRADARALGSEAGAAGRGDPEVPDEAAQHRLHAGRREPQRGRGEGAQGEEGGEEEGVIHIDRRSAG